MAWPLIFSSLYWIPMVWACNKVVSFHGLFGPNGFIWFQIGVWIPNLEAIYIQNWGYECLHMFGLGLMGLYDSKGILTKAIFVTKKVKAILVIFFFSFLFFKYKSNISFRFQSLFKKKKKNGHQKLSSYNSSMHSQLNQWWSQNSLLVGANFIHA